jgi:uncharacterized membrane protein
MSTDPKELLRSSVRAAQERYGADTAAAREARREAFTKAQRDGLTLREIGEAVGLHHSRVGQVIEGK